MDYEYIGNELDLFKNATHWKKYFSNVLSKYIYGDVLEVGSGICANTNYLRNKNVKSWSCLEPDQSLISRVPETFKDVSLSNGTIDDLKPELKFDSILYIDVLEHIENDKEELIKSYNRLRPGGKLIVLSPSYQYLFSPFDEAVGHYRRYHKSTISALSPERSPLKCFYLDSLGVMLSLANKMVLKSGSPTEKQILFWDRFIIRISKILDKIIGYSFGKTIICIWEK